MTAGFRRLHLVSPMGLEHSGLALTPERYRVALEGSAGEIRTTIVSRERRREHSADLQVEDLDHWLATAEVGAGDAVFWLGVHAVDEDLRRQAEVMRELAELGCQNVLLPERTGRPDREAYGDVVDLASCMSGLVVLNRWHGQQWRSWLPQVPLVVAPTPLPDDLFLVGPRPASSSVTVLFIGRFDERKGADRIPSTWQAIRSRFSHVRLAVAGQDFGGAPEIGAMLRALADADSAVSLVDGLTDETRRSLIASADIGICLGRQEFDGIALSEMLAGGLPVVSTDTFGSRALAQESDAVVVAANPQQVVDRVSELISDRSLRVRRSIRAQASMRRERSVQSVRAKLVPLFLALARSGSVPRPLAAQDVVVATNRHRVDR